MTKQLGLLGLVRKMRKLMDLRLDGFGNITEVRIARVAAKLPGDEDQRCDDT